jgi:2,4-dienoyl-CoA reductase-like NADH-dependent reductase (Old Yellow Enzyme family)
MSGVIRFPRIGHYRSVAELRTRLGELELQLPCDDTILTAAQGSPMASPLEVFGRRISNRWCVHPMEGWDGTLDGYPSDWTRRRWRFFGLSGAKLVGGGEAVAVRHDGRANPNQLLITEQTLPALADLREITLAAHQEVSGSRDDLIIGLQLTHSGRFCRPHDKVRLEPRIAYHHPLLDTKFGIAPDDDSVVF